MSGENTGSRAPQAFAAAPEPLPVEVFDSHCHLDLVELPVAEQLAAAKAAGIARVVTIGVDLPTSRLCADTAAAFDDVYAGVAIHPNDTTGITEDVLADIAALAERPEVRAIGETGLDYYRDWAPKDDQHRSFRAHIAIAKRTGKALVIHDRDAHDDVLRLLAEEGAPDTVVFHCFSGDAEMARTCADAGYVMSFAGNVTFKNAEPLREALRVAPLDLLLVETDAPFLTPVPNRGKPNASYLIPHTVRFMAEVKGVEVAELCAAIAATGERVFGPW
ncbi:TatD family hydrolase [Actinomadura parmotrematis]|uniref:TatD family hydrolase n=1 Tax=Actinomadura parmotrematis TaxID=2864039 RepID=A0ABS7FMM3_9ACTN|nr:TatD family hydrolase [Actinomadura parmotrematis]MBW8481642.1 TatD family hydrolase [Actinomadura parmotrematis]